MLLHECTWTITVPSHLLVGVTVYVFFLLWNQFVPDLFTDFSQFCSNFLFRMWKSIGQWCYYNLFLMAEHFLVVNTKVNIPRTYYTENIGKFIFHHQFYWDNILRFQFFIEKVITIISSYIWWKLSHYSWGNSLKLYSLIVRKNAVCKNNSW
jgi:hypothetical protein